jgi:glutathione S-transferase
VLIPPAYPENPVQSMNFCIHGCGGNFLVQSLMLKYERLSDRLTAGCLMTQTYTTATTLLVLLHYFVVTAQVGQARAKYGIKAPAVTGDERFERAYRVQMNMVEQLIFFLPSLWLCALLLSDKVAAAGGIIWMIGRIVYGLTYVKDPAKRGPGISVAFLAQMGLFGGAAWGLISSFF